MWFRQSNSLAAKSDQEIGSEVAKQESAATACGWVVVIGVVAEYLPKFITFSQSPSWNTAKDIAGGVLIALGVMGEVLFSRRASVRQEELGRRKDLEIVRLTSLIEQEKTKRALLQAQVLHVQDRKLSEDEILILKQAVRPFRRQKFWIIIQTSDPRESSEAQTFGTQLESILKAEGWILTSQIQGQFTAIKFQGVAVGYGVSSREAATGLHEALMGFNIHTRDLIVQSHLPLDLIVIEIGFN